jgi:Xaa-Pro aminopeptidase
MPTTTKKRTTRKTPPSISLSEYGERRKAVGAALKRSIGLVFAGEIEDPLHDTFRPHPHFEYLTGVVDEPGAVLLIDPSHPVAARREVLFLRPLNPELEQWDGLRLGLGEPLRKRAGIKTIHRTTHLARFLLEAATRSKSLACLHPLASHVQPVSPDLALFRKLAERIPGAVIEDESELLARLRSIKSKAEVAMIERAIEITRMGFIAAARRMRAGLNEFDIQETLEHTYRENGSRGPAFGTIAGTGINSTVLHYRANDRELTKGEVVCIDSGAEYRGYGADITRTYPVNGSFTKRQREIYDIVLASQEAAIRAVKAGVTLARIDQAARAVIVKAGYGDAFIHGTGHHLGLETHDATPSGPLREGAVITIEPGIYLSGEKLGVRIEDDVVVTKTGCRNLSARIPKKAAEIEKQMG